MIHFFRVYLPLFVLLCVANTLTISADAQAYEKWIEKGRYEEAMESLNSALVVNPDDISLNFFKARVFAKGDPGIYNVDSAYYYYTRCLDLLKDLRDAKLREKLNKIPINMIVVRNMINAVLLREYKIVSSVNTPEAYESFMNRYPDSRYAKDAQLSRDEIVVGNLLSSAHTMQDYIAIHKKYPSSAAHILIGDKLARFIKADPTVESCSYFVQNFKDHEDYVQICYLLYDLFSRDGELRSLLQYYSIVYNLPLNEKQRSDFELARIAWKMGLTASSSSGGACFGSPDEVGDDNQELNRRLSREGAQSGDLQFSLMWNNLNDLDLHVLDPLGEEIFFGHRKSSAGGILDVDMNVYYKSGRFSEQPVENIFWPSGSAPSGRYKVSVVYYLNHNARGCEDPTPFVVRVRCNGQDTLIRGTMSFSVWKPRMTMLEFVYSMPERYTKDWSDSLRFYYDQYIRKAAPAELAFMAVLRILADDIRAARWEQAQTTLTAYSRYFVARTEIMRRIRELDKLLTDDAFNVKKERIERVNTLGEEYSPVLSADEKLLYFCGRDRRDNVGKEDIYVARARDGGWEEAHPLAYINTAGENEAPLSVSADGNTILLFRSGDIYFARKTANAWTSPEAFPAPVNSEYWEGDAMFTSDGKSIIFASNRPGGENLFTSQNLYHGNSNYASDLYICHREGDSWGPAINLGKMVNTQYCERSPYLHPDMKTLYFSSDAYYGLGDLDVFMIKRLSDSSWTEWSAPLNMGRSINTADPDWGYQISASGEWAYFAARDEKGGSLEDIYRFRLPLELRPDPVIALTGRLSDQANNAVSATVHWVNLSTGEEVGVSQSDPQTGNYFILLTAGVHYGYYATSGDFFSISDNIDLPQIDHYKVVNQNIELYEMSQLLESGKALTIKNLFFDYDKTQLRPESFPELNRLAEIIQKYPDIKVEIMGHTDDRGSDDYNQKLSESRARIVADYLVSRGIKPEILQVNGYGKFRPLLPNTSDENRQQNRRVEFRFFK